VKQIIVFVFIIILGTTTGAFAMQTEIPAERLADVAKDST